MEQDEFACRCYVGGFYSQTLGFRAIGEGWPEDWRKYEHDHHPGWCVAKHDGPCKPEHIPIPFNPVVVATNEVNH